MPKTPTNYSNTIIYKIVCNDFSITEIYVGHTTGFTQRKHQHKKCCNNPNNKQYCQTVYATIRKHGGWENWSMIEIEKYPCNDKNEATARERYWFEELNAKSNMNHPQRSNKEWREANKEEIKEYRESRKEIHNEYMKKYREENKTTLYQKAKEHREANKEIIRQKKKEEYQAKRENILERVNAYREKNKELIKQKKKEWYEKNKEAINEKRRK